ncbi:hypothetical protein [Bradyrhizobium sp.]|uniref:hypothetical protein n=1 Tax=Bradyrhizobium sp. TaxID=376 RepID=UPI002D1AE991|nr:hypothetical protein [Bradyrhizobium sp.]HMM91595.1 hypothetical protein [Bradyrhizobium sp.]
MSVSSKIKFCVSDKARNTRRHRTSAQHQAARVSSDVADVVNRPKKRPGRRERSSMTILWAALVRSRTILIF